MPKAIPAQYSRILHVVLTFLYISYFGGSGEPFYVSRKEIQTLAHTGVMEGNA
jgi:hypothetical protein